MAKTHKRLIKFFAQILKYISKEYDNYSVNFNDVKDFEIGALMLKIISSSKVILKLLKKGNYPEAEVISRTNLEALFYMTSMVKTKNGLTEFLVRSEYSKLKMINSLMQNSKIRNKLKIKKDGLLAKKQDIKDLLDQHNSSKEYSCYEAAEKSKMKDRYLSVYRMLSQAVHVEPNYLERFYLKISGKQIVGFNKKIFEDNSQISLVASTETLLTSFGQFIKYKKASKDKKEKLKRFISECNNLTQGLIKKNKKQKNY